MPRQDVELGGAASQRTEAGNVMLASEVAAYRAAILERYGSAYNVALQSATIFNLLILERAMSVRQRSKYRQFCYHLHRRTKRRKALLRTNSKRPVKRDTVYRYKSERLNRRLIRAKARAAMHFLCDPKFA